MSSYPKQIDIRITRDPADDRSLVALDVDRGEKVPWIHDIRFCFTTSEVPEPVQVVAISVEPFSYKDLNYGIQMPQQIWNWEFPMCPVDITTLKAEVARVQEDYRDSANQKADYMRKSIDLIRHYNQFIPKPRNSDLMKHIEAIKALLREEIRREVLVDIRSKWFPNPDEEDYDDK